MKNPWTRLLVLGCLIAGAADAQTTTRRELWMWKDANGVTHYSDVPAAGAKKIEIVGSTPVAAPGTAAPPPSLPPPPVPAASESVRYTALEFTSPDSGASVFGADASVLVSVRVEPDLGADDQLHVFYDGTPIGNGSTLTGLQRGEHTLTASIVGADGREKMHTERRFTVQQYTIGNPRNVGPALKPKPKS
jgi:hypothetical protein